jgi:phosphoenolpyruvate---glycerone phosphotransferase subunit DhaK
MCDAVAVSEVFASPSAQVFYDAFKAANGGAGIACLYGNYAGDNMNVKMAKQLAAMEGIEVKTVVANDDVASAPKSEPQKRMAGHESPRTTRLYDRTKDEITLSEVERIRL